MISIKAAGIPLNIDCLIYTQLQCSIDERGKRSKQEEDGSEKEEGRKKMIEMPIIWLWTTPSGAELIVCGENVQPSGASNEKKSKNQHKSHLQRNTAVACVQRNNS